MAKYRKKPVVIEASQWFEVCALDADSKRVVDYYRDPDIDGQRPCSHCSRIMHDHGFMATLEGGHTVCPGDWIIKGIKGEYYPCKPDIFAATYEEAKQDCRCHRMDPHGHTSTAKQSLGIGDDSKTPAAQRIGDQIQALLYAAGKDGICGLAFIVGPDACRDIWRSCYYARMTLDQTVVMVKLLKAHAAMLEQNG